MVKRALLNSVLGILLVLLIGCATTSLGDDRKEGKKGRVYEGAETNITQITTQKKEDLWPVVSPDGTKVAFMSRQKPLGKIPINYDIWTVDTTTNRVFTQVTNHPAHESCPDWSPEGTRIYFNSPRLYDTDAIWRVSLLGTGAATQITTRDVYDFAPKISPDGKKVAFTSRSKYVILTEEKAGEIWTYFKAELPYIWVANIDGSELTQFGQGIGPVWAPDGSKIAFYSNVTGNWDIWMMNIDGSGLTQLTTDRSDQVTPAWSPDGEKIVFASNMAKNFDIWVMDADGGKLTQLTYHKKTDAGPAWSPNGKYIYFHSDRSGNWDIWRLAVE